MSGARDMDDWHATPRAALNERDEVRNEAERRYIAVSVNGNSRTESTEPASTYSLLRREISTFDPFWRVSPHFSYSWKDSLTASVPPALLVFTQLPQLLASYQHSTSGPARDARVLTSGVTMT